jgi:putative CocE/NonD family hydrolase
VRVRTDFPRSVREVPDVWIPLSDGTRLAARLWVPEDGEADPVPGILEYLPYRQGDWSRRRDSIRHPYFAGHGYGVARVDIRGTGNSDGVLLDEYLPQEQDDALEVLAWMAAQPWCTGAIGMFGISWGGFNGLQIAARRPPEVRSVITLGSTDDRYADDVHYKGGCVLAVDMLPWACTMLAWNAAPPDPVSVGERWLDVWLERLERTPPYVEEWVAHQRRDGYWRHGSVCEDFDAIECPVFVVGGWADGYTNAVPRLLDGLRGPRKGLIGPWAHSFPEEGVPGPAVGFLQECVRWWDETLKGESSGIMEEPLLRTWLQEAVPPRPHYDERPGQWVADEEWPPRSRVERTFALGDGTLDEDAAPEVALTHLGSQGTGLEAGLWCPYGDALDLPTDQRPDDALSLVFTSGPLAERLEIVGQPEVRLALASDRPHALVAVRLCDVAPTGESTLVTRGLLNLAHRESHEHPSALVPGERYEVDVRLDLTGYAVPRGHRLRVAVSPTYWPWAWPSPEPVTLTVFAGAASSVTLPLRAPGEADATLRPFEQPEGAEPLPVETLTEGATTRTISRDVGSGTTTLVYEYGSGLRRLPDGTELEDWTRETFTITEGDPLSARVRAEWRLDVGRGEWRTRVETDSTMSSDARAFHLTNAVTAYEGEDVVFSSGARRFSVARDHV